jgi:hypothetical protein
MPSWAGEFPEGSSPRKADGPETQQEIAALRDFRNRLELASQSQQLASIAALYQTNDVTAMEFKSELARWQRVLAEGPKPPQLFCKPLSRLPPESHEYWAAAAKRLTRHQVTHFVMVDFPGTCRLQPHWCLLGKDC